MPGLTFGVLLCLVVVAGTAGGAATRYERHGPQARRGPAGALAIISLTVAVAVALILFGVALLEISLSALQALGLASAFGVFGALVAARYVDHALALGSWRTAVGALARDVPWRRIGTALSGAAGDARKLLQQTRPPH